MIDSITETGNPQGTKHPWQRNFWLAWTYTCNLSKIRYLQFDIYLKIYWNFTVILQGSSEELFLELYFVYEEERKNFLSEKFQKISRKHLSLNKNLAASFFLWNFQISEVYRKIIGHLYNCRGSSHFEVAEKIICRFLKLEN